MVAKAEVTSVTLPSVADTQTIEVTVGNAGDTPAVLFAELTVRPAEEARYPPERQYTETEISPGANYTFTRSTTMTRRWVTVTPTVGHVEGDMDVVDETVWAAVAAKAPRPAVRRPAAMFPMIRDMVTRIRSRLPVTVQRTR